MVSECEKACDYWFKFREQDGSWSQWFKCSLLDYMRFRNSDDCVTKVTAKAIAAAPKLAGGN